MTYAVRIGELCPAQTDATQVQVHNAAADASVRAVKADVTESFGAQGQDEEEQPDMQRQAGGALPRPAMLESRR